MDHTFSLKTWMSGLCAVAGVLLAFTGTSTAANDGYMRFGDAKIAVRVAVDEVAVVAGANQRLQIPAAAVGPAGQSLSTLSAPSSVSRYAIVRLPQVGVQSEKALTVATTLGAEVIAPVLIVGNGGRLITNGRVIVHYPADWDAGQIATVVKKYNLSDAQPTSVSEQVVTYKVEDPFQVLTIANSIAEQAGVDFAYPSYIDTSKKSMNFVINDPGFEHQWYLRNPGGAFGVRGADANIRSVWNTYTGTTAEVIVIVDDFVEYWHEDLRDNVYEAFSKDFTGMTRGRQVTSSGIHGTAVAGVAAARGGNGIGIAGTAPRAAMINHQIFFNDSYQVFPEEEAGALSRYNKLVDIYNNSWGAVTEASGLTHMLPLSGFAIRSGIIDGRSGLGNVFVFSAGNSFPGQNSNYSAYSNSPYVISVAATNNFGTHAWYSTRGTPNLVNAPSGGGSMEILTTDFAGAAGAAMGNYYTGFSGTSAAAPIVSGVVALMLDANPTLTWQDVRHILLTTAQHNDPTHPSWEPGYGYETLMGDQLVSHTYWYSDLYGFGRVDAYKAVKVTEGFISTGRRSAVSIEQTSTTGLPSGEQVVYTFDFTDRDNLFIENVRVSIDFANVAALNGEIILTSPNETTSVLDDAMATAATNNTHWDFMSVRHYAEPSKGIWTVSFSGTFPAQATSNFVRLSFDGRWDRDNGGQGDGLPDDWERRFFGSSANLDLIVPNGDPNKDGKTNWQHFLDGTDPASRDAVVYVIEQTTSQRGDALFTPKWRKGILVDDRGNRGLSAILYYNGPAGQKLFHEEHWGTVTETGSPAVQKFSAQAGISAQQVIAATDYVDSPTTTLDLIADNWTARVLVGRSQLKGSQFGLNRASVASTLNGLYMRSNPDNLITEHGTLNAKIDVPRTVEVNKPNVHPENIVNGVRQLLISNGFTEQKLTLSVTPTSFSEGAGANAAVGTVTRFSGTLRPMEVILTSSDQTEVFVPARVTIPPGQSTATFPVDAVDDLIVDGTQIVTIRATVDDHTPGVATVEVFDND